MWKADPAVEDLRKLPGWRDFHRVCGQAGLYFDHIERDGRRGAYKAVAYELVNRVPFTVAEGTAKAPLDALVDAYRKAARPVAEVEMALMRGSVPILPPGTEIVLTPIKNDFDIDALLGGDMDMEDLLG